MPFDLGRHFSDLSKTWWVILVAGGVTFFSSLIYLILLRKAAKALLYVSLVTSLFLMFGGGFYVYSLGELRYIDGDSSRYLMRGLAGVIWGITLIALIAVACCWKSIQLGAAVVKATSEFVRDKVSVVITVPIITLVGTGVFLAYWAVSAIYVFTVGEPQKSDYLPMATIKWNNITRYVWIYHFFGLFWISAFIISSA